jgi:hypothetical protein
MRALFAGFVLTTLSGAGFAALADAPPARPMAPVRTDLAPCPMNQPGMMAIQAPPAAGCCAGAAGCATPLSTKRLRLTPSVGHT